MILLEAEEKMDKSISQFERELASIRTGRANPTLLDFVMVEYYGAMSPIKQVAAISIPEASQLYIKPFDKSVLKGIESALNASGLGLTPQNDGAGIRLVFPQMTEQRRRELVKQVGKIGEAAKVNVRNARRDANDELKKLTLPEDDEKGYLEDVQKLTDSKIALVDKLASEKEKDLMTI